MISKQEKCWLKNINTNTDKKTHKYNLETGKMLANETDKYNFKGGKMLAQKQKYKNR